MEDCIHDITETYSFYDEGACQWCMICGAIRHEYYDYAHPDGWSEWKLPEPNKTHSREDDGNAAM